MKIEEYQKIIHKNLIKDNINVTMMKVSLIGLGVIGTPIARNLIKVGFSLTIFNRSLYKCDPVVGLANITGSAQEANRKGIFVPVGFIDETLFNQAFEEGLGEEDVIAVLRILEKSTSSVNMIVS